MSSRRITIAANAVYGNPPTTTSAAPAAAVTHSWLQGAGIAVAAIVGLALWLGWWD